MKKVTTVLLLLATLSSASVFAFDFSFDKAKDALKSVNDIAPLPDNVKEGIHKVDELNAKKNDLENKKNKVEKTVNDVKDLKNLFNF